MCGWPQGFKPESRPCLRQVNGSEAAGQHSATTSSQMSKSACPRNSSAKHLPSKQSRSQGAEFELSGAQQHYKLLCVTAVSGAQQFLCCSLLLTVKQKREGTVDRNCSSFAHDSFPLLANSQHTLGRTFLAVVFFGPFFRTNSVL